MTPSTEAEAAHPEGIKAGNAEAENAVVKAANSAHRKAGNSEVELSMLYRVKMVALEQILLPLCIRLAALWSILR